MPPSSQPQIVFTGGPMGDVSDGSNKSAGGGGRRSSMKDTSTKSSVRWSFVHQGEQQSMMESRSGVGSRSRSRGQSAGLIEDPCDGPFQRIKDEWMDTESWFGIDDCGRLLDIPKSFGSTRTIPKWIVWAWMMISLLYLWTTADTGWFLGDLDHWALGISMVYLTMSLGNSIFPPSQPGSFHEGLNAYLKVYWIIFEIAAHFQLLCTVIFWIITVPTNRDNLSINYGTFMLHGLGLLAVWIDGMWLNRIPVRIKHYFVVLPLDFIYCIWTIIPAAAGAGKSDEGDKNPDDNDSIYLSLDWSGSTVSAVFLMIAILTVFAPLCYLAQFCFSLYTFPWTWNGSKSRKCIDFDMSRSCMSHSRSARRPTLKPDNKNSNGNVSATSRTSSTKDLSVMNNSSFRTNNPSSRVGRPGATSPAPPAARRVSVVRSTSPTRRPATPTNNNSKRRSSSTEPPASRPTSPTSRRASTPTPGAAGAKKTKKPTTPTSPATKRKSTKAPATTNATSNKKKPAAAATRRASTPASKPSTKPAAATKTAASKPTKAKTAAATTKKNTTATKNKASNNKTKTKNNSTTAKKPTGGGGGGKPKKTQVSLDIA